MLKFGEDTSISQAAILHSSNVFVINYDHLLKPLPCLSFTLCLFISFYIFPLSVSLSMLFFLSSSL